MCGCRARRIRRLPESLPWPPYADCRACRRRRNRRRMAVVRGLPGLPHSPPNGIVAVAAGMTELKFRPAAMLVAGVPLCLLILISI